MHKIALVGNPNAGKTTIFNALTGSSQHVGNWAGKTVGRREGVFQHHGTAVRVVDLPGAYSLLAYSPEEQIAGDYIIRNRPALVVNVVDAANLERNLYLTAQLIEMNVPWLLALNMIDSARRRGLEIDVPQLSAALGGVPVVVTAARTGQGLDDLKQAIGQTLAHLPPNKSESGVVEIESL